MSWYLMHRGWMDHPAFKREAYTQREAWEWLIASALYVDSPINISSNPVLLKRGQLSYSLRYLAKAWGWDIGRVRRTLKHFERWNFIVTEKDTEQTIITICNYEKYQSSQKENDTETQRHETQLQDTYAHKSDTNKKEQNTKKEIKEEEEKETLEKAVALWNEIATANKLPTCQVFSDDRKKALRKRLKECGGLDGWRAALEIVTSSDFLMGRRTSFRATFDFLTKKANFAKVMEGNYTNTGGQNGTVSGTSQKPTSSPIDAMFAGFAHAKTTNDISGF